MLNGFYAGYCALESGMNIMDSISTGLLSTAISMLSVNTAVSTVLPNPVNSIEKTIDMVVNTVFGSPVNLMSSAVYRAKINQSQEKRDNYPRRNRSCMRGKKRTKNMQDNKRIAIRCFSY